MLWLFANAPEYLACSVLVAAVLGYAWLTIELSGEAAETAAEGGEDEPDLL